MRSAPILRATALVFAFALALHEVRYLIAGRPSGEEFTAAHGYLPLLGGAAALLLGVAAAMLLRALAFARRTGVRAGLPPSLARTWLLATGALLALHFGQEMVELTLNGAGLGAVTANGALLVLPLAAAAGLIVALGLRTARRALCTAAARARRPRARACPLSARSPPSRRCAPRRRRSRCTSPSALRRQRPSPHRRAEQGGTPMSRTARLALIAGTVAVLVVAFVIINPTGDSEDPPPPPQRATTQQQTTTQTAEAKPKPPPVPTVKIRDGKPAGGKKTISFASGENARIDVTSNKPAEIHLHGYDIEKPVQPGKTTSVRFKADIEGVFEFEDHDSGQQLASVEVKPQ